MGGVGEADGIDNGDDGVVDGEAIDGLACKVGLNGVGCGAGWDVGGDAGGGVACVVGLVLGDCVCL